MNTPEWMHEGHMHAHHSSAEDERKPNSIHLWHYSNTHQNILTASITLSSCPSIMFTIYEAFQWKSWWLMMMMMICALAVCLWWTLHHCMEWSIETAHSSWPAIEYAVARCAKCVVGGERVAKWMPVWLVREHIQQPKPSASIRMGIKSNVMYLQFECTRTRFLPLPLLFPLDYLYRSVSLEWRFNGVHRIWFLWLFVADSMNLIWLSDEFMKIINVNY